MYFRANETILITKIISEKQYQTTDIKYSMAALCKIRQLLYIQKGEKCPLKKAILHFN